MAAANRYKSDLPLDAVLHMLREIVSPYVLGIFLKIETNTLRRIEREYKDNTQRQLSEVIEYWLNNTAQVSWSVLADAVDKLGGHGNLVQELRKKESDVHLVSDRTSEPVGSQIGPQRRQKIIHPETATASDAIPEIMVTSYYSSTCDPKPSIDVDSESLSCSTEMDNTCTARQRTLFALHTKTSEIIPLNSCVERNVILFGRMGGGKSTLGNRILGSDSQFEQNDKTSPSTRIKTAVLKSESKKQNYRIRVCDINGLFDAATTITETDASIDSIVSNLPSPSNLVLFVSKQGHDFDEHELRTLSLIDRRWNISDISALVITHCEHFSPEQRRYEVSKIKENYPAVDQLMGKGIHLVGFPHHSYVKGTKGLQERVIKDESAIRDLIYSCEKDIHLSKRSIMLQHRENRTPQDPAVNLNPQEAVTRLCPDCNCLIL